MGRTVRKGCAAIFMATFLQNLRARRDAIGVELAALSATAAGGKPNMGGVAGGSVDHTGYKKSLYDELAEIQRQLADTSMIDAQENGPWEIES